MARVPLDEPDGAQRLATWRDQPGVLGVRLNFAGREAAWLTDGTADWFWPAAEKARLPVMFLTSGQTSLFARIAERHPQLTLIIDHMGVGAGLRPRPIIRMVPVTWCRTLSPNRPRSQNIRTCR